MKEFVLVDISKRPEKIIDEADSAEALIYRLKFKKDKSKYRVKRRPDEGKKETPGQ